MRCLNGITDSMDMSKFQDTEKPGALQSTEWQRVGHNLATEQQPQVEKLTLEEVWGKKWPRSFCQSMGKHGRDLI